MREPLFTRPFVSLWTFQFVTFIAAFQLLPVIPLRILELGASKAAAGSFLAVYTFASAFSAPVMGSIADHFGRRRMLVIASVLFVVFSLLYAVVTWLPAVLLIGVVHGTLWSSLLSAAGAIMTDFIPQSRRTEGMAYWGIAPTAAVAVAPALGLFVYGYGWAALCVEIAVISGLNALWGARVPGGAARSGARTLPAIAELWDWEVVRTTLSLTVVSFGYGGITSYATILARERHIRPESLFFTVFALSVVAIRVVTSSVGDRRGPLVLLYPALAVAPFSFVMLAYSHTALQLSLAAALWGIALGASYPAFMTFILARADDERRARTFGSVLWAFDTGIGLGSLAIGMMAGRWGLTRAFLVAAALSCLAIPMFLVTTREQRRPR